MWPTSIESNAKARSKRRTAVSRPTGAAMPHERRDEMSVLVPPSLVMTASWPRSTPQTRLGQQNMSTR